MFSTKKKKWMNLKNNYAEVFRKAGDLATAQKLNDCSETMALVICNKCDHKHYVVEHCKLRCCPLCSFQVAKERAKYNFAMCKNMSHPKLLTLTMKAVTERETEAIRYLVKCFKRLRAQKIMRSVRGGAWSVEIIAHPDYCHIHLHAILDCAYIPNQQLFTAWRKILGVAYASIDIRAADSREAQAYVAKEVGKNMAIYEDPAMIVKWYHIVKGVRLWATFGTFYNKKMNELDDEKDEPEFIPACPKCGAHHSMYFARDGPFIWGGEQWSHVQHMVTGGWPEKIEAEICYVEEK